MLIIIVTQPVSAVTRNLRLNPVKTVFIKIFANQMTPFPFYDTLI